MAEGELMRIVFTNIQSRPQVMFRLAAKIITTQTQNKNNCEFSACYYSENVLAC